MIPWIKSPNLGGWSLTDIGGTHGTSLQFHIQLNSDHNWNWINLSFFVLVKNKFWTLQAVRLIIILETNMKRENEISPVFYKDI